MLQSIGFHFTLTTWYRHCLPRRHFRFHSRWHSSSLSRIPCFSLLLDNPITKSPWYKIQHGVQMIVCTFPCDWGFFWIISSIISKPKDNIWQWHLNRLVRHRMRCLRRWKLISFSSSFLYFSSRDCLLCRTPYFRLPLRTLFSEISQRLISLKLACERSLSSLTSTTCIHVL